MLLACSIPVPVQLFAEPGHLRQRDFPRFGRLLGLRTNAGFVLAFRIKSLTNGRSRSAFTSDARRSVQHWPCRLLGNVDSRRSFTDGAHLMILCQAAAALQVLQHTQPWRHGSRVPIVTNQATVSRGRRNPGGITAGAGRRGFVPVLPLRGCAGSDSSASDDEPGHRSGFLSFRVVRPFFVRGGAASVESLWTILIRAISRFRIRGPD